MIEVPKLEIDVLTWIAIERFPALLGPEGHLDVEFIEYDRTTHDGGSYTTFRSPRLPVEMRSEFGMGIQILFRAVDVSVGCLMLPDDHETATMELYVNGEGSIPSFVAGYEIIDRSKPRSVG